MRSSRASCGQFSLSLQGGLQLAEIYFVYDVMLDPRLSQLARNLTSYSTRLDPGEKVLIDAFDVPDEMIVELLRATRACGAIPYVNLNHARVSREFALEATEDQMRIHGAIELQRMKSMDAYIALRGSMNIFESSDVSAEQVKMVSEVMKPVLDWRVNHTKWVVLRWPTPSMAQQAMMSTEAFEDFFFNVCTLDHSRMEEGSNQLAALMRETDRVEIKGNGTDLSFSIKGINAIACVGTHNIPDGEVFSCPVRDSAEGVIQYNAPTVYQGVSFDDIRLEFKEGKIVDAQSSNTTRLNEILDSDIGARYIGEFAIGFNPYIREPMRDILFDEKIGGSFHFTPGQAYEEADNGNKSQVHWDMVCIQRTDYGGGEIWFDGDLIRKDGIFVRDSLKSLNPENLL